MRIDEISFERPWQLTSNTYYCDYIEDEVRKYVPNGLIQVWEKQNTSPNKDHNVVATFEYNGAWEVHHMVIDQNGKIHSGIKGSVPPQISGNTGFISTAKKIYEDHLKRGRKIRISSTPSLWKNYETFIKSIVKNNVNVTKINPVNLNDKAFDDSPCISQVIEHRGKFLNGTKIPLI